MVIQDNKDVYKQIAKKLNLNEQQVYDVIKFTFQKAKEEIIKFNPEDNTQKPPLIIIPNIGRFIPNTFQITKIQNNINDNTTDRN